MVELHHHHHNNNNQQQNLRDKKNDRSRDKKLIQNDKNDRRRRRRLPNYSSLLTLLDYIFSATIAGPAVVGYWRGTWGLSGFYIYPDNPELSSLTSVIIGVCGLFGFSLSQRFFVNHLHPDKRRLSFYLLSRIYTITFGLCCVNAWRGTWQALDLYTEHNFTTVFTTTGISLLALAFMRSLRNISAPPFAISLDTVDSYFDVPTLFRVDNSKDLPLYILDCAFSVGIIGTLVVFVWRGVWVLFDLYLFPENREYSAFGSLTIGYTIVIAAFTLQPILRHTCSRLVGLGRVITADGFLLLCFAGTVNVWRGVWNILDLYLLPKDPKLSCWITHLGCFVFLMLLNCSNSILVRGVYIDGEEEAGNCVNFPCYYLRSMLKVKREKKEARQKNLMVASLNLTGDNLSDKETEIGVLLGPTVNPVIQPARIPESLV